MNSNSLTPDPGTTTGVGGPLFSVVIPTYNRADLVLDAVRSVLGQTLTSFEIIVIDDGSTDDTVFVLEPYADRMRVIRQDNAGLAAARNRGIAASRGQFVAFLDSDDCFEPGFLAAIYRTFQQHPDVGAVFSAEREIDLKGRRSDRVMTKESPGPFFTSESLLARDHRVGAGRPAVVRCEWTEKLGGFDEQIRCAVDCDIWIRYSFHMRMVLQPEPLILRRVHESNISLNRGQDARDWLHILDKIAAAQPQFVEQHRSAYRRQVGKHNLRLGRELLANVDGDRTALAQVRQPLLRACRSRPLFLRAWLYLLWSYVAPSTYAIFRRWELHRR